MVEYPDSAKHLPLPVATFTEVPESSKVNQSVFVVALLHLDVGEGGLTLGAVTVEFDQHIGDVVDSLVLGLLVVLVGPLTELVRRLGNSAVSLRGLGPEGGLHQVEFLAVHPATVLNDV